MPFFNKVKLRVIRAMLRYYHKFFSEGRIRVDSLTLTIKRGIFNPKHTFSSLALLNFLKNKNIRHDIRIVDVGTGTGIIAASLCLNKGIKWVIASDISTQAAKVSLKNFKTNNLYNRVDVLVCDNLSSFRGSAVDLVVSNPPYLPLEPKDDMDRLFCAGKKLEILGYLIGQSRYCLKPRGTLIFTVSSLTPFKKLSELLVNNGFVYIRHQIARTPLDKIYAVDATLVSKLD